MLTAEGKNHIRRYLAGYVPAIAQSIVLGAGNRAESAGDTALQLEVAGSEIDLTSYDFANNRLVYKAPVPDDFSGTAYEVGLYSLSAPPNTADTGSRNLTTFDSAGEDWIDVATGLDATFATTNMRVGEDALFHSHAASTSKTSTLRELDIDLSGHSAADAFVFAYFVANANTSTIRIRFMTDAANYYEYNLGAQTAGYKIVEYLKGNAAVVGTPSWTNISEIQVVTTATSGGISSVTLDAIRIEDRDTSSLDYILVARKVLSVPFVKVDGMAQAIEFTLDVSLP